MSKFKLEEVLDYIEKWNFNKKNNLNLNLKNLFNQ